MKPTQDPMRGSDVLRRTLDSKLSGKALRTLMERALQLDPSFNESFLDGEHLERFRVAGLDQQGDIVLATYKQGRAYRTEVYFRRGDRAKFDALLNLLTDDAKVRAKPSSDEEESEVLSFIRRAKRLTLGGRVIFAESAIESALDCTFGEVDQLLGFLMNLDRAAEHRLTGEPLGMDGEIEHYLIDRRPKRLVQIRHNGEVIALNNEVCLIGNDTDCHLKVHFTWLPDKKAHLIGWFTESSNLFT
jgi:hypothetical protein